MKKIVALVLALALVCVSVMAFAEAKKESPKTDGAGTTTVTTPTTGGATGGGAPVEPENELDVAVAEESSETFKGIMGKLDPATGDSTIADVVGADAGVNADAQVHELFEVDVKKVVVGNENDTVKLVLTITTYGSGDEEGSVNEALKAGKQLIVLIGIVKGGEVNWITVPATANGDGTITVEITVAQLKMIEGADSLIFAIVTQ